MSILRRQLSTTHPAPPRATWGCACESAEDRPVWLVALDLCFWFDNQTATRQDALFGDSGELRGAYERVCAAFAPGEQVNEYYHHVRLCATPALVREIYFLAKQYCAPEEANDFQLLCQCAVREDRGLCCAVAVSAAPSARTCARTSTRRVARGSPPASARAPD